MMPAVDRRRCKAAIGKRSHRREQLFLPRAGAMKKDDHRPAIRRADRFQENTGHALARFGRKCEPLGAIDAGIDTRPAFGLERHTRPVDHLQERRSDSLMLGCLREHWRECLRQQRDESELFQSQVVTPIRTAGLKPCATVTGSNGRAKALRYRWIRQSRFF